LHFLAKCWLAVFAGEVTVERGDGWERRFQTGLIIWFALTAVVMEHVGPYWGIGVAVSTQLISLAACFYIYPPKPATD
jgi:hypothetical protein